MTTGLQATVIPVDDYVRDELYPGYVPQVGDWPFVDEPLRPFQKEDNGRFWFRDSLHFGLGLVPGSIALLDDAQTWGTQLAAEMVGVPPTRGMVNRLAGTHVYLGPLDVTSGWQIQARAGRFGTFVGPMLASFDAVWARYEEELRGGYQHFDSLELGSMQRAELWAALQDAYVFHKRAWYIHFEVMYALAANYLAFYQLAQELGLEGSTISRFLAGRPTAYLRTDEALWNLARQARELGLADVLLRHPPAEVQRELGQRPNGGVWWTAFEAFLQEYGWRTEETCTISTPCWVEDPAPALYAISTFLAKPTEHDFRATQQAVIDERERLTDEARTKIGGGPNLERFNQALASNQAANFAWWNDEHNFLIDRRIQIPVRRISLALGEQLAGMGELQAPEDIFYVFKPELYRAMQDGANWPRLRSLVPERRAYFEAWRQRGPDLPPVLGTLPEQVNDPLMVEIFGLSTAWLETARQGTTVQELRGFPASKGVAEGIARVIHSASELHLVQPGEILVCDGTTTEWTPVFGVAAACVCDTGGSLTHAAIVSREYSIPCVVGAATATARISSGDRIRVDGSLGTVRILG